MMSGIIYIVKKIKYKLLNRSQRLSCNISYMIDFANEGEGSGITSHSRSILVLLLASNHF